MTPATKLSAPREHLSILVDPAAALWRFDGVVNETRILDRPLGALRAELRARLELAGPLIVTGHQVEFFHAGVFAKNIAVSLFAEQVGGQAAFVAVDSDTPKTRAISSVAMRDGSPHRVHVAIPGCDLTRPLEQQPATTPAAWRDFFADLARALPWPAPLLDKFAAAFLTAAERGGELVGWFDAGRAATEHTLGLPPMASLRISQLCATPEFRAWAAHLLLSAPSNAAEYNAALAEFRKRHRVKNLQRPVPPLQVADDVVELPLWTVTPDGRRRRLRVGHGPGQSEIRVFADDERVGQFETRELADAANHSAPWRIERAGLRLRPRALALSGFLRLFLADVFIHGLGGAAYDEITESWLERALGARLTPRACVTATLLAPLPRDGPAGLDLVATGRRARDLRWNPQRYAPAWPPEWTQRKEGLIAESLRLRDAASHDHARREDVFRAIREINQRGEPLLREQARRLGDELRRLEGRRTADRAAADREYFYALHPIESLSSLVTRLREAIRPHDPPPGLNGAAMRDF